MQIGLLKLTTKKALEDEMTSAMNQSSSSSSSTSSLPLSHLSPSFNESMNETSPAVLHLEIRLEQGAGRLRLNLSTDELLVQPLSLSEAEDETSAAAVAGEEEELGGTSTTSTPLVSSKLNSSSLRSPQVGATPLAIYYLQAVGRPSVGIPILIYRE